MQKIVMAAIVINKLYYFYYDFGGFLELEDMVTHWEKESKRKIAWFGSFTEVNIYYVQSIPAHVKW